MSLFSKSFVRGLQRRVRLETKQHPRWKIEARSARKSAPRTTQNRWRWLVPLLAIGVTATAKGAALALPILLAWSATLMLFRAAQIQHLFFAHSESTPFSQFPVTEQFVFRHAARRLLRTSLWLGVDVLFFLAAFAVRIQSEAIAESLLLAAACAVGIWAAAMGGAITLVWIRPGFPFGIISGFALSFGWAGILIVSSERLFTPASIYTAYESFRWCLPTGWVCLLIEPWLQGNRAPLALPLALLAGLGAASVAAVFSLRRAFTFWPPAIESENSNEPPLAEVPVSRVSEVEDAITSRIFLSAQDWTRGEFLERTAARWLTPREHRVMNLALILPPGWTAGYPYACLLLIATPTVAWLAQRFGGVRPEWILVLGTLAGLGIITPLFGGGWTAFDLVAIANRATAVCNVWPVSLRELRGCVLKLNLVRFLFALPCWLCAGASSATFFAAPISQGIIIAGKSWLLVLALQLFFLAFKYSASTNDTSSGFLFVTLFGAICFSIVAAAGTAVFLSFTAGSFLHWLIAVAVVALLSWLLETAYRRAWRAQQFDLLAKSGVPSFD